MKYISHYFPFFILSILLYGLFFYYNAQTTIVTPIQLNSGKQSMQLQFVEIQQTPAKQAPAEIIKPEPVKKEQEPVKTPAPRPEKKTVPAPVVHTQNESQIKIARQELRRSIHETSAESDALLKSEQYEKDFHLDLPAAPVSRKAPAKKLKKPLKAPKPQPPASSEIIKHQEKPKRVFKPSPADNAAAPSSQKQGVLQEAIVVSGNKPTYPNRAVLRNQQGRVVVKLTVTMSGKAKNPKIITSSGYPILDNAVLEFISKELFMPAHKGEEKITTEQLFSFRFELK
ncbi:energy transducer TonB [Psychromonas aquimarina]|uniref:energy transducer TonB n=1 Tax=Psychromonas aquimarina TaxID=444919 RepID=UPI00040AF656|nr:energy transducer TonB [Psychromonas aquimarina]